MLHILMVMLWGFSCSADPLKIQVAGVRQEKSKLAIGSIQATPQLDAIAKIIADDLACAMQRRSGFVITRSEYQAVPDKPAFKKLFKDGYATILFLSAEDGQVAYRLYDTFAARMIIGKSVDAQYPIVAAHSIADKVWETLLGQEGMFSTKIAYCKEHPGGTFQKDIYVRHLTCQAEVLVHGGKLLAPRWNSDVKHPRLLYSEATPSNIRLMSTTMQGDRSVVSNFDGLNMLPSFASDGKRMVYCFTIDGTSQLFYYETDNARAQGTMKRLTHNRGNNLSPCLLDNGDVIFSSDFQSGSPQLFHYHRHENRLERLTTGGYSACPTHCAKNHKIAYCKMSYGIPQIFTYDMTTREHEQVTYDMARKDECTWSPCGNYLAYAYETDTSRRIAIMNIITREQFFLTSPQEYCAFPAWSPRYTVWT